VATKPYPFSLDGFVEETIVVVNIYTNYDLPALPGRVLSVIDCMTMSAPLPE
jgi:hypothetical protein